MTFFAVFGLAGFFFGIVLHLYLFSVVLKRRERQVFERALLCLVGALLLWYLGNFLSLLLRQMDVARVALLLGVVDVVAFSGLAFLPALLLHTHWIYYKKNYSPLSWEKWIVFPTLVVLYGQLLVLPAAVHELLSLPSTPPIQKLGLFTGGFLVLLSVSYYVSCFLELRILRQSTNPTETGLFRHLLGLFLVIPIFNFYVFFWGGSKDPVFGEILTILALLSSLAPSSVVGYYIYKYQFLQIMVHRSVATALLILLTLAAYLVGIRRFAQYVEDELAAPPTLVEGAFLVAILLLFPPLSRWLENRVGRLFSGEIKKYREVAEAINRVSPSLLDPRLFKEVIEEKLKKELQASQVRIHLEEVKPDGPSFYPLQSGGRRMGFLEIDLPDFEFSVGEKEAMQLLANEIAASLERCQLLESKLKMERELAQKSHMEDLGRMAATVAHNVKSPLSSMKTLMQLLHETENLTDEQRGEVEMMIGEVDRLSKTITNLLKFSGLETQPSSSQDTVGEVKIDKLVESLKSVFRGDLESARIRLETNLELENPSVRSDPDILLDILGNLLSNGIEASSPGKRIKVEVKRRASQVAFSIEDEGLGIPAQVRKNLFDPFVTTKARGTGLGLAIVKKRIEQLGGSIGFVSPVADNRGTRFTFTLPQSTGPLRKAE